VWGRALDLKLGTAGGTGGRGGVRRSSASRGKQPSGGMSDGRGTTAEKAVCLRFQCGLSLSLSQTGLCASSLQMIAGVRLKRGPFR
jgi:hypothetical protein